MLNNFWYVLRSKPNKELFLAKQLEFLEIEFYYPQLTVRPVNPRSMKIKPYFPGYLFIRIDQSDPKLFKFDRIPGTVGLLHIGDELARVPEGVINGIRARVEKINETRGEHFINFKKGDPIKIDSGPFAGYEAIFDTRLSGTERVKVLLSLLQDRKLLIELPANFISEMKSASFPRKSSRTDSENTKTNNLPK